MLVYNFATFDVLMLCWCLHKLPSVVVYAMRILKKVRSVGNPLIQKSKLRMPRSPVANAKRDNMMSFVHMFIEVITC